MGNPLRSSGWSYKLFDPPRWDISHHGNPLDSHGLRGEWAHPQGAAWMMAPGCQQLQKPHYDLEFIRGMKLGQQKANLTN